MLIFLLLLLVSGAAIAFIEYTRVVTMARDRVRAGGRIAWTRQGPVEYAILGSGPPVLLVHGAGGGYDQGVHFGAALARRGLRVIAMSRFGYLRTPLPADASAQAQADAHAALLEALGIERAAVIGASAGAPSALQMALRHPRRVAALVLLVPVANARPGGVAVTAPAATRWLFDTALRSDFLWWAATRVARRLLVGAILATPPRVVDGAEPGEKARVARAIADILPVSERRLGLLNDAEVTASLPRYPLERIAAPTLAISAEDDLFGTCENARHLARQIPEARLIVFPSGGHLWVGHDEEVAALVERFVKEKTVGPSHRHHPGAPRSAPGALLQGARPGLR